MLDEIILEHLKKMDDINESLINKIDEIFKKLDIDKLLNGTEGYLDTILSEIEHFERNDIIPKIFEESVLFSDRISLSRETDDNIKVPIIKEEEDNDINKQLFEK
jgi:hypothetical protein